MLEMTTFATGAKIYVQGVHKVIKSKELSPDNQKKIALMHRSAEKYRNNFASLKTPKSGFHYSLVEKSLEPLIHFLSDCKQKGPSQRDAQRTI